MSEQAPGAGLGVDIDSMEAGEALDVLVAERIIGFTVTWDEFDFLHGPNANNPEPELVHYRVPTVPHDEVSEGVPVPRYSTEIEAAWQVLEYMRSQGWVMTLSVNEFVTQPWDCRLFWKEERRVIAHGKDAPEAICRAAIAAVLATQPPTAVPPR